MPYKDRMPIHSDYFLPPRRTDLIAVKDLDLDALHRYMWANSDPRNQHSTARPTVNNYVVAMLIAQGRVRRKNQQYYVRNPDVWERDAIDVRGARVPDGYWRCQFCAAIYEKPPKPMPLVACWTCAELIGLRTHFTENLWREDGKLKS